MSKSYDIAEVMRDHVERELSELDGITVITYRQKNLASELQKTVGKAKGSLLIIHPTGGTNPSPDARSSAKVIANFDVSIWSSPIIAEGAGLATADDIVEAVIGSLHGFTIDRVLNRRLEFTAWIPGGGEDLGNFLVYTAKFQVPFTISSTKK